MAGRRADEEPVETGWTRPKATEGVKWAALALGLAALAWLYWRVAPRLVQQWASDDDYTHGFLILPLALYFVWNDRERLARLAVRPGWLGAGLLVVGLAMLVVGTVGAELFLRRSSIVVVVAGLVWLFLGWSWLTALAFPIVFLLFMVPLPAIVMNAIAFPLQLFAAQTATFCLQVGGIPVLREGNVITLADTTLEVAEACSGIRSLQALLALGAVYGYFTQRSTWKRWALLLLSIPIAIAANAFRVSGTGFLAHYFGSEMAQGFYHSFAGWIVFVVAFVMLLACGTLLAKLPDGGGKANPEEANGPVAVAAGARSAWPLVAGLALIAAAGLFLHSRTAAEAAVPRKAFTELPLTLEGWRGRDLAMDPSVLDILKLTDYSMRAYLPPAPAADVDGAYDGRTRQRSAPIWLYVGYYGSQRTGSTYHSPKNCLPGSGWQFASSTTVSGVIPGAPEAKVNRIVIEKGFDKQLILYWYQDRGRTIASEYDAKGYLIWDAMTRHRTDGSLVRISTPIVGSEEDAYRHALDFLKVAWRPLTEHLPG
jgi:exosortase D (VPLPA-CTERM-specific)